MPSMAWPGPRPATTRACTYPPPATPISRSACTTGPGPSPQHRAIGEHLRQLRRARNRADYADQLARPVATAQWAVRQARQLLAQLQALGPPPPAPNDASAPASPETRRSDEEGKHARRR